MELRVVTEKELPGFRSVQFSPESVLERLPDREGVLLFDEPPGIGKTTLGRLLITTALDRGFDLVIFVAPTRALIGELEEDKSLDLSETEMVTLRRRPSKDCGSLDVPWQKMEKASCAALGKDELCRSCPNFANCFWPDQLDRVGTSTKLIVLTEQYLLLNPTLIPSLIVRTSARKPLVILDEALFVTQNHLRRIENGELKAFAETLNTVSVEHPMGQKAVEDWYENVGFLLDNRVHVDDQPRFYVGGLEHATLSVQSHGRLRFGPNYRHLAHDLSLLNSPLTTGQWQLDGNFEIVVRVDLGNAQAVVLSPSMEPEILSERLQRNVVVANPGCIFRHSKTIVSNIRDSIGTSRSLGNQAHRKRVVDTFSVLALRNALQGRRTVFVCKKRFLGVIASETMELAKIAGFPLRVRVVSAGDRLDQLSVWDVPIINFGVVGINSLKDYDAIYAIGNFNITDTHLTDAYNQNLPPHRRHALRIRSRDRRRVVEAAEGGYSSRYHAKRASSLHRTLERRVVLQAVGRARPFTSATEVVLFQQDDFGSCFGDVEVFDTLGAFRTAMKLPTVAEISRAALGDKMRRFREAGASYRKIAAEFGVSVSTAHKALKSQSLNELIIGDKQ